MVVRMVRISRQAGNNPLGPPANLLLTAAAAQRIAKLPPRQRQRVLHLIYGGMIVLELKTMLTPRELEIARLVAGKGEQK